jgi:hypothetical protein
MIDNEKQRRLVLIGIHRKGEKGFKKRFSEKENLEGIPAKPETLPLTPEQIGKLNQISNLLSE